MGLAERLPAKFREPILKELTPIREIFLRARPPRIALAGNPDPPAADFLATLSGRGVSAGATLNGWTVWTASESSRVEVCDARQGDAAVWNGSLPPDVVVLFAPSIESLMGGSLAAQMEDIAAAGGPLPSVLVVGASDAPGLQQLRAAAPAFADVAWATVPAGEGGEIGEMLCTLVSSDAGLEMARFAMARKAQAKMARRLLGSFSGICGVVALQPLPLADMPIITTLQSLMVSLVIYASGRKFSAKLLAEFLAALGINVGAGFVFRESARALLKVIPIAGSALSGGIAGVGTYAIGRAAIAYFIEGSHAKNPPSRFRLRFRRRPAE